MVAPTRCPPAEVERFVERERGWITAALDRIEPQLEVVRRRRLADGGLLPYLGHERRLRFVGAARPRPRVELGAEEIVVRGAGQAEAERRALLERWYRGRARPHFEGLISEAARRHHLRPGRLSIRDQRTRWGSCSPAGDISLNWRLLLAPHAVGAYVVEHELAHLELSDHSPGFWALLRERMPGYEHPRRWLSEHGGTLRF